MIFVKQTDMPESCSDCGMLQFYEDDNVYLKGHIRKKIITDNLTKEYMLF